MRARGVLLATSVALVAMAIPVTNVFAGTPDLSGPKSFHRFPVYWAGDELLGMPLEDISEGNGFTFFYGDCELSGTDHPSCAPPVQIQVGSTCDRWASELNEPEDLFSLRGAKATQVLAGPSEGGSGPLEIFTGRVTVVIFAEPYELKHRYHLTDPIKVARTAAAQLRTVHQADPRPLPPPVPGSLTGRLPCQKRTATKLH